MPDALEITKAGHATSQSLLCDLPPHSLCLCDGSALDCFLVVLVTGLLSCFACLLKRNSAQATTLASSKMLSPLNLGQSFGISVNAAAKAIDGASCRSLDSIQLPPLKPRAPRWVSAPMMTLCLPIEEEGPLSLPEKHRMRIDKMAVSKQLVYARRLPRHYANEGRSHNI